MITLLMFLVPVLTGLALLFVVTVSVGRWLEHRVDRKWKAGRH